MEKAQKYFKWRDEVARQIEIEIALQSDGRGFDPMDGWIAVRLIWYSPDISNGADPDLDNMAKPYVDGLEGESRIIRDDRFVRDLRILKVDINDELQELPGVLEAKNSPELETAGEFVLVVVEPYEASRLTSIAEEFEA